MQEEPHFDPNTEANTPSASNSELRAAARAALRGRWTNPVLCTLVYMVIASITSVFTNSESTAVNLVGIALTLFIVVPLAYGYSVAFLRHMRGEETDDLVTRPFDAFKSYSRYLGTSLLYTLLVCLWTLLLIVPGIIMSFAYAMTPYIMHDHPELTPMECIRASKAMMKGHKWQLFCLRLSFIGWALLCILTLGIGTLWLQPYMQCADAKFYEELKAQTK
ncbi:MAG: DUF975 family protein [Bacteroidales bacterium]|nr:DUF975 family protein [Bacteroidales bacterium]